MQDSTGPVAAVGLLIRPQAGPNTSTAVGGARPHSGIWLAGATTYARPPVGSSGRVLRSSHGTLSGTDGSGTRRRWASVSGTVVVGGATQFSRNSDLSIQLASNPFKRHRINAETVTDWEELDPREGVGGAIGRAAAAAAIPGRVGKAVGAGLGAAMNSGHTVRVSWADGKQSIIALPEKQFMVFSVLLKDRQIATELPEKLVSDVPPAQPGVSERIADFAFSVSKGKQDR